MLVILLFTSVMYNYYKISKGMDYYYEESYGRVKSIV